MSLARRTTPCLHCGHDPNETLPPLALIPDRNAIIEECADLADQKLDCYSGVECTYRCDVAEAIRSLKNAGSTLPEALPKDDVPLKCEVIDGAIQFIVGEKVLAHATNICPRFYDAEQDRGMYHVTDQVAFAKDVARELNREREDGSTRLSDMMDDAIAEAISHGAEGVEETPSPQLTPMRCAKHGGYGFTSDCAACQGKP